MNHDHLQRRLPPAALRRTAPWKEWDIETSDDLRPLQGSVGQERAEEALDFGVAMLARGYNLFAIGPPQLGKHQIIEDHLRKAVADTTRPPDWCYVHNFQDPRTPLAIRLPAGRGLELKQTLHHVIAELRETIPASLGGEDFQTSQQAIEESFRRRQDAAIEEIRAEARQHDIAVIRTPSGVVMAPMEDDEVLGPAEFQERSSAVREQFEEDLKSLHNHLESTMTGLPRWEQERRRNLERLERTTVGAVIGEALLEIRSRFAGLPQVQRFLDSIEEDLLENRQGFLHEQDFLNPESPFPDLSAPGWEPELQERHGVNVLIGTEPSSHAPVIREHHPTLENLVGRIDHQAHFGALRTDYSMIHPGALHRANGGFLILDARDLLRHPFGWAQLKRALRSRKIRIESPAQIAGMLSTVSLEPEPVDLNVKVILVADRQIFELLSAYDPDLEDLFKVIVDFSEDTDRIDAGEEDRFLRLLAGQIKAADQPPFTAPALGRIVEEASRMAGDAQKVTLKIESLRDLVCEAAHFADHADPVDVGAVDQALHARRFRCNRLKERYLHSIARNQVQIETTGSVIAQVNGLSVVQRTSHRFGIPSRITASIRLGAGEVVDIAREVAMGGPIHSRGVLILSGFLGNTFGLRRPLSLQASLVFEQTYGPVDGDSASLAEAIALLSALADVPLRQSLAITGSIDQRGNVQAVGGINEKIEGFFDACTETGRSPDQGVIIPASNQEHLMLRPDIVAAVEEGTFSVITASRLEEALETITGLPAGAADQDGHFDPLSLFGRVDARLDRFARAIQHWRR